MNMELEDIALWESMDIKRIEVTQGFTTQPLTLSVRKFVPLEGDMIHKTWNAGDVQKKVLMPTYAIVNFQQALQAWARWINDEGTHYFDTLLDTSPGHKLLRETYSMAIWTSNHATVSILSTF
jgi:hypothetical protein